MNAKNLINRNINATHPVKRALRSIVRKSRGNTVVERFVLEYGRAFIGIERPSEFPLGKIKNCYVNAGDLAGDDQGIYVEGFAMSPGTGLPFQHAWLTTDGVSAIDVTLQSPAQNCWYFGIAFSGRLLGQSLQVRKVWGLLDASYDTDEMQTLLEENRRRPPIFPFI